MGGLHLHQPSPAGDGGGPAQHPAPVRAQRRGYMAASLGGSRPGGALPGPLPSCLQGSFPSTGRLRCDPWLAFGAWKCLVLEELAVTGRSPRRRSLWLRPEASRPSAARAWNN